jgi:hypothetical protein
MIFGTPTFLPGEEVLLFLDTWPDGSLRVYHWFLGKYQISTNLQTKQAMAMRQTPGEFVRIAGRADGTITETMKLDSYLERIRGRIAATVRQSASQESRFFRQSRMVSRPPEFLTATGPLPSFTFINPSAPPRWFEPDSGQQVVFKINPAGAPNNTSVTDVAAAMSAWSSVSNSSLRVVNGGSTTRCGLLVTDGENTISFNNCDNYSPFSPPAGQSCSGILAAAGIVNYSVFQTKVVNGITFYKALEGNLSFNPYASCYFSNSCNVREVATHELGHALGLGHSLDTSATMYAYAHFDGRCASLRADDMNAIRFIYPVTGAPPTPTPTPTPTPAPAPLTITTTSLPAGQVNVNYAASLTASGGVPPYTWAAIAGTMPGGISLSLTGSITGRPTTAGVNSVTIRVTTSTGLSTQRSFTISISGAVATPPPTSGARAKRGDFDGDGKSDVAVWRGTTGAWQVLKSTGGSINTPFGTSYAPFDDIAAPGDFDGDSKIDCAVFRQSDGQWLVLRSSDGATQTITLGASGDTPVAGDYDGDKITDPAVWRGSTGAWYVRKSSTGLTTTINWGSAASPYRDIPTPGDFDGDGKMDIAVWRPGAGHFYIIPSSTGSYQTIVWGLNGDIPVIADYDGDGKADAAVWRPGTGLWYVRRSSNNSLLSFNWGAGYAPYNDVPVPGDFDGDGKADFAVFRPGDGAWYIVNSSTGAVRSERLGTTGDTAVSAK